MKLFYKLYTIIATVVSARLGGKLFRTLWSKVDEREPPAVTTAEAAFHMVIAAAVLEGATKAAVAATVKRGGAEAIHHLTGSWPGEEKAKESED